MAVRLTKICRAAAHLPPRQPTSIAADCRPDGDACVEQEGQHRDAGNQADTDAASLQLLLLVARRGAGCLNRIAFVGLHDALLLLFVRAKPPESTAVPCAARRLSEC